MLREIRKNLFRNSVRNLLVSRISLVGFHSAQLALKSSFHHSQLKLYREVFLWPYYYKQRLAKYPPKSLKIVNQAFADNLNKYEAASLIICHFLTVDTDEEEDWLKEEEISEYSEIYSSFEQNPLQLYRKLKVFRDNGNISNEIFLKIEHVFDALFAKYPEYKKEEPEEPKKISWWELAYNNSKNNEHRIVGRFLNVSEVVEYVTIKETGRDLFWRYPFQCQYDDWEPTMPPTNDWSEISFIAIPWRGWETLWKEYQGIGFGANFDHWEALKKQAYVRPKDQDIVTHQIIGKPYQRIMSL